MHISKFNGCNFMAVCGLLMTALAFGCARTSESASNTCDCNAEGCAEHGASCSHASCSHSTHTHDGWWCDEHGVPEDVCAQCHPKLAAEFQKRGDWCGEHDRPDSQCFICHPELKAKFAARYEAKLGKQPPEPTL
jgi:hypothetical protein